MGWNVYPPQAWMLGRSLVCVFLVGKGQGSGVDAVAESRGARAVGKYVAKVASAAGARDFYAAHAEGVVLMFDDGARVGRDDKAGPSATGIELGAGEE